MKSISDLKSVPKVLGISKYNNKKELGNKIVLLDNIQDPGNAGTIIRNCVAFGIDTIIFSPTSVYPFNLKVLRSSAGMIYNINILIDDLNKIIYKIKQKNIPIIATSLNAADKIEDINKEKYAIIFGNEGNGISDDILSLCDKSIKINMNNNCESLNVADSNGIVLYELYGDKK